MVGIIWDIEGSVVLMDYAKIHMLKSDLQSDGIRGGALERQLCCQCGALINGIRALTRREKKTNNSALFLQWEDTARNSQSTIPKRDLNRT